MYLAKKNGRNRVEVANKQEETDWQRLIVNTFIELLVKQQIPAASQIVKDIQLNKLQGENLFDIMNCIYCSLSQACNNIYKNEYLDEKLFLVTELAKKSDLSDEEIEKLKIACVLHNIGSHLLPEKILIKPGPLTNEERKQVLEHPLLSAKEILRPLKSTGYIINIIEHHHENWDGTGYPGILSGETIPKGSRILYVINAYYAMIDDRPYRKALAPEKAFEMLINGAGTVWDPQIVDQFISILRNKKNKDLSKTV